MEEKKKLGFLVSGRGSNLQAVLDAIAAGVLNADAAIVISNSSKAEALRRASLRGVPTAYLSSLTHPNEDLLDQAIRQALLSASVDIVVLAGYMKKLGPTTIAAYKDRIINIHPSLLPKFGGQGMYGMNVHKAVVAAGETETGVTVHLVDGEYDCGRILAQRVVSVAPGDTAEDVAKNVLVVEHELLVSVLREFVVK